MNKVLSLVYFPVLFFSQKKKRLSLEILATGNVKFTVLYRVSEKDCTLFYFFF
jgi:hypothetical protein